jgi:hypothetical protein
MQPFRPLTIGLVLLFPVSARAQSVTVADLVGTWKGAVVQGNGADSTVKAPSKEDETVTFLPDTTSNFVDGKKFGRYRLKGDSIWISDGASAAKITLKSQELRIWQYSDQYHSFRRVDAPTPKP